MVTKWVENNGLKLNTKETQLLLFGRKKRERELASTSECVHGGGDGGEKEMCEVSRSVAQ